MRNVTRGIARGRCVNVRRRTETGSKIFFLVLLLSLQSRLPGQWATALLTKMTVYNNI